MRIQLQQTEIEEALHDYIEKQGFSLANKKLEITFTAARGDSGMKADLDITDARFGSTNEQKALAQVSQAVQTAALAVDNALVKPTVTEPTIVQEAEPAVNDAPWVDDTPKAAEAEEVAEEASAPVKAGVSLFN